MAASAGKALFAQLMRLPDEDIDLAQAALLIAEEEYPELDHGRYLARLDELGREVRSRIKPGASATDVVGELAGVLARDAGLRGNRDDYYDPRNSFLNDVLDRRLGIPITLAVAYVSVGRRGGLDVRGVGFPMHFLAKYVAPDGHEVIFDPFDEGHVLSHDDCRQRLAELSAGGLPFRAGFLAATPARSIVTRLLNNLKQIYLRASYYRKAAGIIDRLLLVDPRAYDELRDRGAIHAELKNFAQARADFEAYLQHCSQHEERFAVRQQIEKIDNILSLMDD